MSRRDTARLEWVTNEFLTTRAALLYSERHWHQLLEAAEWEGRTLTQVRTALARLEATYKVRMFSEFEGILRERWAHLGRDPDEHIVNYLIDHIGANSMDPQLLLRVHEVQRHRNDLVHLNAPRAAELTFEQVRQRLSRYAGRLPDLPD